MKITTILPVSRTRYLDRVMESVNNQTYPVENLIVVFDGSDEDFLEVRNKLVSSFIGNLLCVKSNNAKPAFSIRERRNNIVNIHNQIRELVTESDYVFSIEDDGILPPDALEKLVSIAGVDVGVITGVEIGRWGVPYIGAWNVDDMHDTKLILSVENKTSIGGVEEIDACGLYCALINAEYYKNHKFFTDNGIGPDVNMCLFMKQHGLMNLIDWSIHVTHLTNRGGVEMEIYATDKTKDLEMRLEDGVWKVTY